MREQMIDLEIRIAYQDDLIEQLNDIITKQQKQIDQLEKKLNSITTTLKHLSITKLSSPSQEKEPPPPHY